MPVQAIRGSAPGARMGGEAEQHLQNAKDLYFQIIGKTQATTTERSKNNPLTQSDQVKEQDFDILIHISQR